MFILKCKSIDDSKQNINKNDFFTDKFELFK